MKFFVIIVIVVLGFNVSAQDVTKSTEISNTLDTSEPSYFKGTTEYYKYSYFNGIVKVDQRQDLFTFIKPITYTTNEYVYIDHAFDYKRLTVIPAIRLDYFGDNTTLFTPLVDQTTASIITATQLSALYQVTDEVSVLVKPTIGFQNNYINIEEKGRTNSAYGIDIGLQYLLSSKLSLQTTFWNFNLDSGFVYVDDEGLVDSRGKDRRIGVDIGVTYQINDWLFFNSDFFYATSEIEDNSLEYEFAAEGGISIDNLRGFSGGIGYRYSSRDTTEDVLANENYLVVDTSINYTYKNFTFGMAIENLFNAAWGEPEFATASRLTNKIGSVDEGYFVPEDSFFMSAGITYSF
ncbi:hypothetical protein [Aquimarina sp. 2201CG14-23]|uniref:hypothetical protein n=1 Tax=Aquimarina mycalae TaxID=3040073 RepID=UPI002477F386|nr:hypothetical protein [Aquimarina sp. 2201CG14-23]MDH7447107.1 hypothetical protein [Aquimarina sp. 2201CG14-23]